MDTKRAETLFIDLRDHLESLNRKPVVPDQKCI